MRIIIQRVSEASVTIDHQIVGSIGRGFLVLLGIVDDDGPEDVEWLIGKMTKMRIFPDDEGKMNRCLKEVNGELLIVSQFTLHANTRKGNRPSFIKAARPEKAIPLYELFLKKSAQAMEKTCASGKFGADMQIALINDGPVTIMVDSKLRE